MPERIGPIKLTRPLIAASAIGGLLLLVILISSVAGGGASKAEIETASPTAAAGSAVAAVTNGGVSAERDDLAASSSGPEATRYGQGATTGAAATGAVSTSCAFFVAVQSSDAATLYAELDDAWRANMTQDEFAGQLKAAGSPRYRKGATSVLLAPGMTVVSKDGATYAWGRTKSTYANGPFKLNEYSEIVWVDNGKGWQLLSWDPAYDVRIERSRLAH